MSVPPDPRRPFCPHCGKAIGTYEPLWWVSPRVGAERTSWLKLGRAVGPGESLWHAFCAETYGVDGG